jgi:cytochrome c biogenesis protein CcdA
MERLWFLVVDAPWRAYPAAALALLGLALVARGLWFGVAGSPGLLRQARDAFAWIRCFQVAVGGLSLVGLAAAWYWREPWLLVLALGVLGEELLETSRILTAIKQRPNRLPTDRAVRRGRAAAGG